MDWKHLATLPMMDRLMPLDFIIEANSFKTLGLSLRVIVSGFALEFKD